MRSFEKPLGHEYRLFGKPTVAEKIASFVKPVRQFWLDRYDHFYDSLQPRLEEEMEIVHQPPMPTGMVRVIPNTEAAAPVAETGPQLFDQDAQPERHLKVVS